LSERDLVFIGGGHTHALVLRMLAMKPIPNVRLTLISDTILTPYSGMLPGYIAGHYSMEQTHLDLNKLAKASNARFVHGRVTGINLNSKTIFVDGQADIFYDKVSINTGSTPNRTIPGAKEFAVGVKPVSQLADIWHRLLAHDYQGKKPHWAIVGGGAAGVEVSLAIAQRFKNEGKPIRLSLVQSGQGLLPNYTKAVQNKVRESLESYGVDLVTHFKVAQVEEHQLVATNNAVMTIDKSIWCTPATAPDWPKIIGLNVDEKGFIAVNKYLQSTSHEDVFATGDIASMAHSPRPKAGVYAVRSAPGLLKNLRSAFRHKRMSSIRLQRDFLSLVTLGGKKAVGQRSGLTVSGNWVWHWKNHIDNKFMNLFSKNLPSMSKMEDDEMHCAGCGSKIGPELLAETLSELKIFKRPELNGDLSQAEDAAVAIEINENQVLQSIDGFRAFTDDLYRLGIVATHHAINDLYAMGVQPTSVQVWANLEFNHPRLIKRDFKRLMRGITQTLVEHETTLVGGHSTEGLETHVSLVVNGHTNTPWAKNGIQENDWLILNKPIGSGIILAADMQSKAPAHAFEAVWGNLLQSNRDFFQNIRSKNIHAATDVTGFGLIGHLLEMAEDTEFQVQINSNDVPLISGALELSQQGIASTLLPQLLPLKNKCDISAIDEPLLNCLFDPQTNGGLLVSVPEEVGQELMALNNAWKIGEVCTRNMDEPSVKIL